MSSEGIVGLSACFVRVHVGLSIVLDGKHCCVAALEYRPIRIVCAPYSSHVYASLKGHSNKNEKKKSFFEEVDCIQSNHRS